MKLRVVLVALVVMRYHTLNGLAAGSALLMLMAAMKLLETRTRRDQFVIVGAGLFLLLAACLDRQALARFYLGASKLAAQLEELALRKKRRGRPDIFAEPPALDQTVGLGAE